MIHSRTARRLSIAPGVRWTHRRRLRDTSAFGATCQPACSAGGTLCPDPSGFLSSINPCCSNVYTAQPNDGYCGGGASPAVAAVTGSTVGAETCSAGGVGCPDPSGFLASLNPCCSIQSGAPGAPTATQNNLTWLAAGIMAALILTEIAR